MEPQGMTPEEKAAVMQFMGTTYGQAHQQDKMLVGGSSNLQPKSQELKKVFEQTAHMPTVSKQPQQPQQAAAPPAEVNTVTPEQAAQEILTYRLKSGFSGLVDRRKKESKHFLQNL